MITIYHSCDAILTEMWRCLKPLDIAGIEALALTPHETHHASRSTNGTRPLRTTALRNNRSGECPLSGWTRRLSASSGRSPSASHRRSSGGYDSAQSRIDGPTRAARRQPHTEAGTLLGRKSAPHGGPSDIGHLVTSCRSRKQLDTVRASERSGWGETSAVVVMPRDFSWTRRSAMLLIPKSRACP